MLNAIIAIVVTLFVIGFVFGLYVQAKAGFKSNYNEANDDINKELAKMINGLEPYIK